MKSLIATLLAIAGGLSLQAAKLGDPAPALTLAATVKGEAVDLAAGKGKQTYVVEFWATWCGPCLTSIPHLTELQKKYKDKGVTFIGISDEPEAKVKPFVEKMGAKMDYVVAVDDARKTYKSYMEAYGQNGIPTSFVVDKEGRILWVGHPMGGLDEAIDQVLAGKFDIAAAQKEFGEREAKQQRMMELNMAFGNYVQLNDKGEKDKAAEAGAKIIDLAGKDANLLNQIAWSLLTNPRIKNRDAAFAAKVAEAAVTASGGKDPNILDTYAKALFESGKKAEAIAQQKKAISAAPNDKARADFEKTLKTYEADSK